MTDQEPKNELVDMIMNERFVAAEELIRESLQTKIHESLIQRKEVVAENLAGNIEEEKQDYESFFKSAMKKFGISSPADLKTDAKKKEFFDYVDKNFKGMKESYVNEGSYGMMRRGGVEGEFLTDPSMPAVLPQEPITDEPFSPFGPFNPKPTLYDPMNPSSIPVRFPPRFSGVEGEGNPIYNPPVAPYHPRGNPYTNPPAPKTPPMPRPMKRGGVEGEMQQMDPRMMQQMMQQMMMMQQQGGMGGMPPMMDPQKKKI